MMFSLMYKILLWAEESNEMSFQTAILGFYVLETQLTIFDSVA